ncbi:MAG: cytochrome c biogenesis protein CcsA [Pseudomonadota bacterium]
MDLIFIKMAFFFYVLNIVSSFVYLKAKSEKVLLYGKISTNVGLLFHLISFILRWMDISVLPVITLPESVSFFLIIVVCAYLYTQYFYKAFMLNLFLGLFVIIFMFFVVLTMEPSNANVDPIFKNLWFPIHVITAFIGYTFFALATFYSFSYIIHERRLKSKKPLGFLSANFPSVNKLDELNYKSLKLGFIFLTVGIVSGIVWANSILGRLWGWDPKEVISVVTWFIYLLILHLRFTKGFRGRKAALASIIGFIVILISLFCVNFMSQMHMFF